MTEKKFTLVDFLDIAVRGYMPEVVDLAKKLANKLPQEFRNRNVARLFFITAQAIERLGWPEKRIAEGISDVVEVFGREIQSEPNQGRRREGDIFSQAKKDITSSDNPEETAQLWLRRAEALRQLAEALEEKPQQLSQVDWGKLISRAAEAGRETVHRVDELDRRLAQEIWAKREEIRRRR